MRSTDNLKGLVDKALLSKEAAQKAVQEAMKGVMGSPIIDLQSFIVLANEMQTQCARVTLRNGDDDEQIKKSRAILEERVDSSGFFGKLDRILEIVEDTRVDEPFHGLVVASTLGRRNEMRLYGTKAVHGLRHVLERVTPDANWAHPVLLMTAALFQGDPDPIELRQLETYFDDGHHAEVLEAESGISAGTFQRHIEKALKRAREKWRAGGA